MLMSRVRPRDLRAALCVFLTSCSAAGLAGCEAFPTQGPNPLAIQSHESDSQTRLGYVVVDLTPAALDILVAAAPAQSSGFLDRRGGSPELQLGVGDIVNVTIFEAVAGGLFIPPEAGTRGGNSVTLPPQEVDRNGNIQVPFAGAVPAAGRSLAAVKATIETRLRNRAIEPQAIVTLQESRSTFVTVSGDVNQPTRFALARSRDRLLDAIGRGGGSKWPPYETYVTLQRSGRSSTIYYNKLLSDAASNVFLYPGDVVSVSRQPRAFLALGASGQNGVINFEAEALTLAQAVARAGGVLDARGDPAQTFLYRLEQKQIAVQLNRDLGNTSGATTPVIYRVNLREPQGYFLATRFPMRDRDILFVSNAASVELTKFLQLAHLAGSIAGDVEATRFIANGYRR